MVISSQLKTRRNDDDKLIMIGDEVKMTRLTNEMYRGVEEVGPLLLYEMM